MNTRFDGRLWIGALGVTFKVKKNGNQTPAQYGQDAFAKTCPCADHACGRH